MRLILIHFIIYNCLRINLCLPYVIKLYSMAMDAISSSNTNKPDNKKKVTKTTTTTNTVSQYPGIRKLSLTDIKPDLNAQKSKASYQRSSSTVPNAINQNHQSSSSSSVKLNVKGRINLTSAWGDEMSFIYFVCLSVKALYGT